jgi:Ca-activated chloride channel family protein
MSYLDWLASPGAESAPGTGYHGHASGVNILRTQLPRLLIILIALMLAGARGQLTNRLSALPRQASARSTSTQDHPLFSVESDLVVLHATVKDRKGRYVTGLSKDAFTVFEGGQPQDTTFFSGEDAPVTVGLLIDSSGSMHPNRDLAIAAATAFVETSNSQDEVFALAFNDSVTAALPRFAPFTSDPEMLRTALGRAIAAHGRTALYDAIAEGVAYAQTGKYERKVLVVVSDGGDNASRATFAHILTMTQSSNVVIYTVALVDPLEEDADPRRLKQLARASGGEAFRPTDARQVTSVLQNIARDIRNMYTIGYVPPRTSPDGTFRRIRLVSHSRDGRTLDVRTRTGYLVEPEAKTRPDR